MALDRTLFELVNGAHAPWADLVMIATSAVGTAGSVWLFFALLMALYPRCRAGAWRLVLAVGLAYLVVDGGVKPLVERARPFETIASARVIDTKPSTSSFPSGHAAAAAAGALAASRVWPAAAPALWMLAGLIACARVYLGVHYPGDVAAGMIVGIACAWFVLGGREPAARAATRAIL